MFGNTIQDLPSLLSYGQAVAHYESIVPIRGSNNLRPLCVRNNGRRRKHMQIIRRADAVVCRIHDTDVVSFFANGDIVLNNGGWISHTTHSFISGILTDTYDRPLLTAYTHQGKTILEAAPTLGNDKKGCKVLMLDPVTLKIDHPDTIARTTVTFVNATAIKGYYLKRSPMGMRRKEVEGFRKYARACAKLIDPNQYHRLTSSQFRAKELYFCMRNAERWGKLIEFLLPHIVESSWSNSYKATVNIKKLDTLIDDAIKYTFAEDLFEERETANTLSNDNAKYLTGGETYLL